MVMVLRQLGFYFSLAVLVLLATKKTIDEDMGKFYGAIFAAYSL